MFLFAFDHHAARAPPLLRGHCQTINASTFPLCQLFRTIPTYSKWPIDMSQTWRPIANVACRLINGHDWTALLQVRHTFNFNSHNLSDLNPTFDAFDKHSNDIYISKISQTYQIVGSWDFKVARLAVALPYVALCFTIAFSHIKCQHLQSDANCQFAFQESTPKVNTHDSCDSCNPKVDHGWTTTILFCFSICTLQVDGP